MYSTEELTERHDQITCQAGCDEDCEASLLSSMKDHLWIDESVAISILKALPSARSPSLAANQSIYASK